MSEPSEEGEGPRSAAKWVALERTSTALGGSGSVRGPRIMEQHMQKRREENKSVEEVISKKQMKREQEREAAANKKKAAKEAKKTKDKKGKGDGGKGKGRSLEEGEEGKSKKGEGKGAGKEGLDNEVWRLLRACYRDNEITSIDACLHNISQAAIRITAEPEKNLPVLFPFFFELHDALNNVKKDGESGRIAQHIQNCAFLSAVKVMRDIVPDYKIRGKEEDGPGGKGKGKGKGKKGHMLSKQVFLTQKYEKTLLKEWERVLERLNGKLKTNPAFYIRSLCSLCTSNAIYFNTYLAAAYDWDLITQGCQAE